MKHLVISLLGPDRPGIVDQVSDLILNHGGNWQASSMSHLVGLFAGILEISVPDEQSVSLTNQLQSLPNLQVLVAEGVESSSNQKTLNVCVTSNDRPGIVREVSRALNQYGVNVLHLETHFESAPNWGHPLFKAEYLISLPTEISERQVKDSLEAIADDLMVDIESPTEKINN
jgi:glycine cleavage system regulatory protein